MRPIVPLWPSFWITPFGGHGHPLTTSPTPFSESVRVCTWRGTSEVSMASLVLPIVFKTCSA